MKKSFPFLMLFISIFSFSQIHFEKGYFITNSGEKTECLIRNNDWKNNPLFFDYKADENADVKKAYIKDVQLFEIYNQAKYVRANAKIDTSSNNLNDLSKTKDPEFTEQQVFLKELIDGDMHLYKYSDGNLLRFFYQTENGDYEPLIYKVYEKKDEKELPKLSYNEEYKKQLEKIMDCSAVTTSDLQKLKYSEKYLSELFIKYNKCSDSSYEDKTVKTKKDKFNLYIRPRINSASADMTYNSSISSEKNYDMGNKMTFGIGLEAEYVFPFNRNKWAIIAEPNYQYFKSENTFDADYISGGKINAKIDYSSIDIPVGIRHYMFLDNKSKLFINVQYVLNFVMNSKIELTRTDGSDYNSLKIRTKPNVAFGFGYNYNNKYGVEARVFTKRDLTYDYFLWQSNYENISLIFSYNLF